MRTGESEAILRFFREKSKLKVIDVDATDFFLAELDQVVDPEIKRKRIGLGFIKIFEEEAAKIGNVSYLKIETPGTRTITIPVCLCRYSG